MHKTASYQELRGKRVPREHALGMPNRSVRILLLLAAPAWLLTAATAAGATAPATAATPAAMAQESQPDAQRWDATLMHIAGKRL